MFNKNPGQKQFKDFIALQRQLTERNMRTGAILNEKSKLEQRQQAATKGTARRQPQVSRAVDQFSVVEAEAARLRQRAAAGRLSRQALENKLIELMVEDGQGDWWMIGASDGQWYRFDGDNFVPARPPGRQARGAWEPWSSENPYLLSPTESGGEGHKFLGFFAFSALGLLFGWILSGLVASVVGPGDFGLFFCPLWVISLAIAFFIARRIWRGY